MNERQVGNAPSSEPQDSPAGEVLHILVVEDVPADAELIERELDVAGLHCRTRRVDTEAELQAAFEQRPPDLVLSDYSLPTLDGMRVLELARKHAPDVPVVIVTGSLDEETAVECMKAGAADYVLKENLRRLVPVVRKTLESVRLRRQREEASAVLAATEERLRLLGAALEAAANAMVITDREGSIVWVNPAFTLLTGYEAIDVLGRNPRVLRSGHHDPQFYADMWSAILAGQVWHGEMVNRRKDGSLYHEEMTITPVREAAGEISHFIAVQDDVSERRRAAERERARLELLQAILDAIPYPVFFKDAEGRYRRCNRAFAEFIGLPVDRVIGRTVFEVAPEELARLAFEKDRQLLAHPGVQVYEATVIRSDGLDREVVFSKATCAGEDGRVVGLVGVVDDVTERRQIERRLRQAQRMEAVGRLAGGVAHDFNNLLQAMLALTQVLRSGGDRSEQEGYLGELEQHIRRGAQLTRQLLLFSRLETPCLERLDLNQVVNDGVRLLRRLLRESIEVDVVTAAEPLMVEADRVQLEQVLVNLAINAADAMPTGGVLTLRTVGAGSERAWLEVADTGCGIPDELREHLFEPFFTTKAAGQGTGLGLAVVHGIVTGHRGSVSVESEVGRGTTIRVGLPLSPSGAHAAPAPRSKPAEMPRGNGERVLLVEDEVGARRAVGDILKVLGYRVVVAATAEQAFELAMADPPDLLLSDVVLPGRSGAELARSLGDRWPALKVVLMSGYTDDESVMRAAAKGTLRLLAKPFDMATLASALRAALDTEP